MPEITASKYLISVGWDEVPHLNEKTKRELLASTAPHLRKARSQGIPSLGAGAIYPIEEDDILVAPFKLPRHWKRGYAMDVGWKRTAALWGAEDPETQTLYLYSEHYRGQAEPVIHATAVKARGAWMTGAIDPASRGRQQADGAQLLAKYQQQELNLVMAVNGVETGIYECWEALSTGRIKVFTTLTYFMTEYRLYRRDENGKIVKKHDHLMDCMRYLKCTPDVLQHIPVARPVSQGVGFTPLDRTIGY